MSNKGKWRPGRDLNPGPAGDSRLYYSGIAEKHTLRPDYTTRAAWLMSADFHKERRLVLKFFTDWKVV